MSNMLSELNNGVRNVSELKIYTLTVNDNTATTSLHYTFEGAKARAEKLVDMTHYVWVLDADADWTLRNKRWNDIAALIELLEVSE